MRQDETVHEFYRPLGLDAQRRVRRERDRSGWSIVRTATGLAAGGIVLAASAAILAFLPGFGSGTSKVDAEAVLEASVEPTPPAVPDETEMAAAAPAAPSIMRMNEDGGVSIVEVAPFAVDPAYTGSIRVLEPGSLRQSERLAHIPDSALLESSAFGMLPRRAEDGRRPLDVYAGAHSASRGTRIALVVGGLGISQTGTMQALEALPRDVTLAFAASGNSLERWMQTARRSGHELLLQAPMEPFGFPGVSPGPNTLTAEDAAAGDFENLHRAMGRLTNYVGVMNFMGARLTSEANALEPVLAEIARRGLLYVDDGSSGRSLARDIALAGQMPFAEADRLVDAQRDPASIRAELDTLERSARAEGTAIGIASAFDASVATIAEWVKEAEARGVDIVPISALAFDPEAR